MIFYIEWVLVAASFIPIFIIIFARHTFKKLDIEFDCSMGMEFVSMLALILWVTLIDEYRILIGNFSPELEDLYSLIPIYAALFFAILLCGMLSVYKTYKENEELIKDYRRKRKCRL